MRHMLPLLALSFILVNVISGYLNADPSNAVAATTRSGAIKATQAPSSVRPTGSLGHGDFQD